MENRKPSPKPAPVDELVLDFDDELDSGEREAPDTVMPPFEMEAFARKMDVPASASRSLADIIASVAPPATISVMREHSEVRRAPSAQEVAAQQALEDMRTYLAEGDHSGALVVAEALLEEDRDNVEAKECILRCQSALEELYLKRIGSLNQVPVLALSLSDLRTASLDNRAGFVVSLMDGVSSLEMILDITGMPTLEALRVVLDLMQQGVITLS